MTSDELERLRKLNELRKEDGLTEEEYNTLKAKIINQRTESSYDKSTNPETPVDSSLSTKRAIDERINEIVENAGIIGKILRKKSQEVKEFREQQERIQKKMCEQVCEDIDGNVYKTVKIGNQLWMAENLKTTRYNDGTPIPNVTDDEAWKVLSAGAYCWFDNKIDNGKIYGALYNWFAIDTGKLSPEGWRVPTDEDWSKLTDYLGGEDVAGGKLKTTGTLEFGNGLWEHSNKEATNETGFSALPGGYRCTFGSFHYLGTNGFWWSSTESSSTHAWSRFMYRYFGNMYGTYLKTFGYSLRCVRDLVRTEDE